MEQAFIIALVALTSVIAYGMTKRLTSQGGGSVGKAIRALFDYAGTFVLFLVFNIAAGAVVILLVRGFTPRFVGLYQLENLMLLFLSAAQGFVFQRWWRRD